MINSNNLPMAKIDSLKSLDAEIKRLQTKAKDLESRLENSFEQLQDNYPSMIMNSMMGSAAEHFKGGVTGVLLRVILNNEKLANAFSKIINEVIERAATGVDWLARKMAK
jgi:hypothetical protein